MGSCARVGIESCHALSRNGTNTDFGGRDGGKIGTFPVLLGDLQIANPGSIQIAMLDVGALGIFRGYRSWLGTLRSPRASFSEEIGCPILRQRSPNVCRA